MTDFLSYVMIIIIGILCVVSGYKTLKNNKKDSVTLVNKRLIIIGIIGIILGLLGLLDVIPWKK